MDGVIPTAEELKAFEAVNKRLKSIFSTGDEKHRKGNVVLLMVQTFHTRHHIITTSTDNASSISEKFPALLHIDCVSLVLHTRCIYIYNLYIYNISTDF